VGEDENPLMPRPQDYAALSLWNKEFSRALAACLCGDGSLCFVPDTENNIRLKVNHMRIATSRVADTDEMNSGETEKITVLPMKSKAWALARQRTLAGLRLGFGTLALSMLATFAGSPTAASAAEPSGEILIGLVTKTEVNPYFVKLRQAATAEAEEHGAKLLARFGKFDGDNEGQVAAIENFISAGVKGILITPSNSTGVLGAVKKARDKGILVIGLDTATDPADAVDATLATDNFQAGVLQGQYARKALGDKTPKLAMLDGTPGGTVDAQRHDGFLKGFGIKEGDPAIVGKQNTHGALDEGQTAMENLLTAHPEINVVYTINEPAAEGAYAAIKKAGKQKDIVLTSIDGGRLGVQYVKDGKIAATVMQFPKKMAVRGVDYIIDFVKTGKKPSGFIDTGAELITDKPFSDLPSKDTKFGVENCWG
jgi:fructose transport system substrate-binding protein